MSPFVISITFQLVYNINLLPKGFKCEWRLWASPLAYGVGMGIMSVSHFASYAYAPVTIVTVIGSTTPVFALILSRVIIGTRVSIPKVKLNYLALD